jgi:hypothetical protein
VVSAELKAAAVSARGTTLHDRRGGHRVVTDFKARYHLSLKGLFLFGIFLD